MQFAVHPKILKLAIACLCVTGLTHLPDATSLFAQPAAVQIRAAEPQNNMMTSVGYKEDQGNFHAEMELQSVGSERRLVVSFHNKKGEQLSLGDQARFVDRLLARVLHDHPDLMDLEVMFGEGREAFIPPLDAYLVQSPEWNSRTGLPRHGPFSGFFVKVFNSQNIFEPLQEAFRRNGYAFKLDGVSRIDIEKIPSMHNAKLPKYIDLMYFNAKRI